MNDKEQSTQLLCLFNTQCNYIGYNHQLLLYLRNIKSNKDKIMKSRIELDAFDVKILQELQLNGGLTNQELAEKIGLSASPCSRRVKILEENGIIENRVTLLDRKKLGLDITAIIQIGMDRHTPEKFNVFESQISAYEEVIECYLITGQDADYIIKVVVPDMDAFQEFLLNHITTIPGVSSVTSSFVMRRVVDTGALPLKYLD